MKNLIGERSHASVFALLLACLVVPACSKTEAQAPVQNVAPAQKAAPRGPVVKAGGWVCNQAHEVMGNNMLRDRGMAVGFQGCGQIGADISVNILDRTTFNGHPIIKVGNAGGVGWVAHSDIR